MHAWTWLLQRISAFVLLIVLGFHIWLLHFAKAEGPLKYADIILRLKTPGLLFMDILLLFFGLYHSLYGTYSVYLDFTSGTKERVVVFGFFAATGLIFLGFGMYGLIHTLLGV
jgi:succinate dehydrogenase / fumarate reductase membrane anchor subunit